MNAPMSSAAVPASGKTVVQRVQRLNALFAHIPNSLVALLARFSIAAVFWNSGQTKVKGLMINIVSGDFQLGWPQLSDSVVELFTDDYRLPLLSPHLAASLSAVAEHVCRCSSFSGWPRGCRHLPCSA